MTPRFCTCIARTPPMPRAPIFDSCTMSFCISTRQRALTPGSSRSGLTASHEQPRGRELGVLVGAHADQLAHDVLGMLAETGRRSADVAGRGGEAHAHHLAQVFAD